MNLTNAAPVKQINYTFMQFSRNDYQYYSALHDIFLADYHEINQYVLNLYTRPRQFMNETGPPLDRFLREYTIPGAPGLAEVPTSCVLEFISQIDEFSAQTAVLFNEHKAHINRCTKYMQKVAFLKDHSGDNKNQQMVPHFTELTPELIKAHEGLKKIKEKADSLALRLETLQNRWAGIKGAVVR